jgi:Mrp family chromosome partitioning ATPase
VDTPWTSQDLRRFGELVDHLKSQFALVIIDMPPILGLAETLRLTVAADNIALIIRWGRTERHLVSSALDALRNAGGFASAVILNDIDVKAQQRRGYRDRTVAYSDENLYRVGAEGRERAARSELIVAESRSDADPEPHGPAERSRDLDQGRSGVQEDGSAAAAKSDIERLYAKYGERL